MSKLSDKCKEMLKKPVFAHLATLMPDGAPQVSPVWIDIDGDLLVVNSAAGRVKDKNMRRDARVAISVTDPNNAYQAFMLRGHVTQVTTDGADAHIDRMAKKYMDKDTYPFRQPTEVRVIYRIAVDQESAMG